MRRMATRTVQISVKMSQEDYALLVKAADKLWHKAVLSKSGILLGLAKIAAENAVKK
jgi:hypothetical protein